MNRDHHLVTPKDAEKQGLEGGALCGGFSAALGTDTLEGIR